MFTWGPAGFPFYVGGFTVSEVMTRTTIDGMWEDVYRYAALRPTFFNGEDVQSGGVTNLWDVRHGLVPLLEPTSGVLAAFPNKTSAFMAVPVGGVWPDSSNAGNTGLVVGANGANNLQSFNNNPF